MPISTRYLKPEPIDHLSAKAIKSLRKHLKTGYETDEPVIERLIDALKLGKIRVSRGREEPHSPLEVEYPGLSPASIRGLKKRIENHGYWFYYAQYWTGRCWDTADCIGGFIGFDFFGSGYERQMLEAALENYTAQPLNIAGFVCDPYQVTADAIRAQKKIEVTNLCQN